MLTKMSAVFGSQIRHETVEGGGVREGVGWGQMSLCMWGWRTKIAGEGMPFRK